VLALENFAGFEETTTDRCPKRSRVEKDVDEQINQVMWVMARRCMDGLPLDRSEADDLLFAIGRLSGWAEEIAASAVPDPVGE
jgi:hypothetical protein